MKIILFILLFGLLFWGVYLFVLLCNILGLEAQRSKNFSKGYRIYLTLYLSFLLFLTFVSATLYGGAWGGKPNYMGQCITYTIFHLNAAALVFHWHIPFQYKWLSRIIGVLAVVLPILSCLLFTGVLYNIAEFSFSINAMILLFGFLSVKLSVYNYRRFMQGLDFSA
ncbi:hypothetical protein ACLI1A_13130 [Flavobacterium sp. RHBU_3]|uniref:hypothetical protein n=1 Tax=Flavobacterium sp. RHBU_3 TaxID=3391184 RepID=UPI003984B21A